SPLEANRLPVPDPLSHLPVPTTGTPGTSSTLYGGVQVVQLPLINLPRDLYPGIYDWIEIVSGTVIFHPGVYVIRGAKPDTGIGLNIKAGTVTAAGVMFYVTNSAGYDIAS